MWGRLVHGVRRLRPSAEWEHFAGPGWADQIMRRAATDRHHAKQGRSIGRLVLEAEGRRLIVYLKRHYRLPWWQGLLALLRPSVAVSPGMQEWEHLEWARTEGFPVPEAVAGGDFIGPWVVAELPGGRADGHAAAARVARRPRRVAAIRLLSLETKPGREMARQAAELHAPLHQDLYLVTLYSRKDTTRCRRRGRGG